MNCPHWLAGRISFGNRREASRGCIQDATSWKFEASLSRGRSRRERVTGRLPSSRLDHRVSFRRAGRALRRLGASLRITDRLHRSEDA
jgi:hypothetical protein